MTKPNRKSGNMDFSHELDQSQRSLAKLDQKIGEAVTAARSEGSDPKAIIRTITENAMEFGLWETNGAAQVIAAMMINAMSCHLQKYNDPAKPTIKRMDIVITSDWPDELNDTNALRELLLATEDHICRWIAFSFENNQIPNRTSH